MPNTDTWVDSVFDKTKWAVKWSLGYLDSILMAHRMFWIMDMQLCFIFCYSNIFKFHHFPKLLHYHVFRNHQMTPFWPYFKPNQLPL